VNIFISLSILISISRFRLGRAERNSILSRRHLITVLNKRLQLWHHFPAKPQHRVIHWRSFLQNTFLGIFFLWRSAEATRISLPVQLGLICWAHWGTLTDTLIIRNFNVKRAITPTLILAFLGGVFRDPHHVLLQCVSVHKASSRHHRGLKKWFFRPPHTQS
jgi:hypothetical protein